MVPSLRAPVTDPDPIKAALDKFEVNFKAFMKTWTPQFREALKQTYPKSNPEHHQNQAIHQRDTPIILEQKDPIVIEDGNIEGFQTKIEAPKQPIHLFPDPLIHDEVQQENYVCIVAESMESDFYEKNEHGDAILDLKEDETKPCTEDVDQIGDEDGDPTVTEVEIDCFSHGLANNTVIRMLYANKKELVSANEVFDKSPQRRGYLAALNPDPPDGFDQLTHGLTITQLNPATIKLGAIVLLQKNEQELPACALDSNMYSLEGRMLVSIIKKGSLFGIRIPYGIEACKVFDEMCRSVLIYGYAEEVCVHVMTDLYQPMYNDSGCGTEIPLFEGVHINLTTISRTTPSAAPLWQYHTLVGLKQPTIEVKLNEGGGSVNHTIDHMNLEARSLPKVLLPLYQSSSVRAQKTTMAAVHELRQTSQEVHQSSDTYWGQRPAALRARSQRLSRGFNEAFNWFADEGWSFESKFVLQVAMSSIFASQSRTTRGCSTEIVSIFVLHGVHNIMGVQKFSSEEVKSQNYRTTFIHGLRYECDYISSAEFYVIYDPGWFLEDIKKKLWLDLHVLLNIFQIGYNHSKSSVSYYGINHLRDNCLNGGNICTGLSIAEDLHALPNSKGYVAIVEVFIECLDLIPHSKAATIGDVLEHNSEAYLKGCDVYVTNSRILIRKICLIWWTKVDSAISHTGLFQAKMSNDAFQFMRGMGMIPLIVTKSKYETPIISIWCLVAGEIFLSHIKFPFIRFHIDLNFQDMSYLLNNFVALRKNRQTLIAWEAYMSHEVGEVTTYRFVPRGISWLAGVIYEGKGESTWRHVHPYKTCELLNGKRL